ncbi:RES family NAD+ phosphorylase [Microbacteriaceae bacterium K1510]|nr:RES family NAD+ phosphorylase [Microbacteriaceae bacterium K1510]
MPQEPPGPDIPTRHVRWPKAWRIIASRYPPIDLFERVSDDPKVWEALIALEQLTNPRVRDDVGEISLVPPDKRIAGPNASWVMAAFTHINRRGSRFSNGRFGVYYAAGTLETAVAETAHHFARFAADSRDPPRREDMRVLVGTIDRVFEDVDALDDALKLELLDPDSYERSQPFAAARRDAGSDGLVYPSVRHRGGQCVAAFWPNAVGIPVQERHLQYEWNGTKMSRYFDFSLDVWIALP